MCGLIKQLQKTSKGFAEMGWLSDVMVEHVHFHNAETKLYEDICFQALSADSGITSIITDGAARHAHTS